MATRCLRAVRPGRLRPCRYLYKLDFDPLNALTPVGLTTVDPGALVVNAGVPVNTVQELVAYAKANPGKLNYGSSIGIGPHFVAELFKVNAGVDIVHVPYRGGGPMVTDLVAGQVQMTVNGKSVLLPHIQSGKLRALAVTGDKRWKELPNVPTLDGDWDISTRPTIPILASSRRRERLPRLSKYSTARSMRA